MHYAYRSWRRQWGSPRAPRCGGALVWQLNDCWPCTSWALADYYLVKKPAFYTVKRDLSPVAVAALRTHDSWIAGHTTTRSWCEYDVWIASDGSSAAKRSAAQAGTGVVEVELRFISIRTGRDALPAQRERVAAVLSNGTTGVCDKVRLPNPPDSRDAFVIVATLLSDGVVVSRDVDWPQPYKYLSFAEDRGLQVRLAGSRTSVEITALRPTKGVVFAERPGLKFSDNGFDVMPGDKHIVHVEGLGSDEQLEWMYLGMDEARSAHARKCR